MFKENLRYKINQRNNKENKKEIKDLNLLLIIVHKNLKKIMIINLRLVMIRKQKNLKRNKIKKFKFNQNLNY